MPNVVKGSRQEKMVVVPHRPGRRSILIIVLSFIVVASSLSGFAYAYYQTLVAQRGVLVDQLELVEEMEKLASENSDLNQQIAILDRSSAMDQKVTEEVQETITRLREQVASLEKDIIYYRSVVSEEADDTGLTIASWDITPINDFDRYQYKLAMRQQDADGDTFLSGYVNINLVGEKNGKIMTLPLKDISKEQEKLDIKLRFKFFQIIEGELVLPPDFSPDHVHIAAVETEPVKKTLDQNFSWVMTN